MVTGTSLREALPLMTGILLHLPDQDKWSARRDTPSAALHNSVRHDEHLGMRLGATQHLTGTSPRRPLGVATAQAFLPGHSSLCGTTSRHRLGQPGDEGVGSGPLHYT